MRSMKVDPCAAVIRTRIWSDSTRVPPVTAERSPPLSRMTGADSPVIADLSTEATPSTISPSDGIRSPASTTTRSPGFNVKAETSRQLRSSADATSLALASVRVRRRAAACALPRPSATASARFANRSVNQSHRTIWNENPVASVPAATSRTRRTVVSTVTTSTTNMTGFLIMRRGSSLRNASGIAGRRIAGSSIEATGIRLRSRWIWSGVVWVIMMVSLLRTGCRPASPAARRSGPGRGRGRRSGRRRSG